MENNKAIIVVPIYAPFSSLSQLDIMSIQQCCSILSNHKICFVKPSTFDIADYQMAFPSVAVESFDDKFFEGIQSYNELMLSTIFYERFLNYEYLLIYQLDAYVFKDQLLYWCEKGYDYIGAPWLKKDKYYKLYYRVFLKFKYFVYKIFNKPFRIYIVGDKVGNGGFSLRKVKSFYDVTLNEKELISTFLSMGKKHSEFNEDVFWATAVSSFKRPTVEEALRFAYDQYPNLCFARNVYQLPFGCHGWSKDKKILFWKDLINVN